MPKAVTITSISFRAKTDEIFIGVLESLTKNLRGQFCKIYVNQSAAMLDARHDLRPISFCNIIWQSGNLTPEINYIIFGNMSRGPGLFIPDPALIIHEGQPMNNL